MQLTENIYIVGSGDSGFSISNPFDCTVYLVDCGSECVLIDAGIGVDTHLILNNIKQAICDPCKINKILLTHGHGDHAGGAKELADACGAEVFAMQPVASFIENNDTDALSLTPAIEAGVYEKGYRFKPCEVAPLTDEEVVVAGKFCFKAIKSEGHSAGHCCYLMNDGPKKILFSGDSIQFDGKVALQAIWDCDLQKYVNTIHRLAAIKPDALLPAHGCVCLNRGSRHTDKAEKIIRTLALPKNTIGD